MINLTKIILIIIILLSFFLRVYKLDQVPPSLSWDEAAVGYNGWTIANYGQDEYGKFLPFYFRSFRDDKHPVHIYATAFSTKILGLNEFSTRLPSSLFGVFNVLLIYFLAKILFKKEIIGLAAALFLAISPYNLHFSHFNHEVNFALFFFLLALIMFYLSLTKFKILLPISLLSFIICFITYHPSKILVPITLLTLLILYFKNILKNRKGLIACLLILFVFSFIIKTNPELLGIARASQNSLSREKIEKTKLFQLTGNDLLGTANLVITQYFWHFSPKYLFIQGDEKPRLSSQTGEFYQIDLILILAGVLYLFFQKSKEGVVLLIWLFTAPLPSSLVSEAPHAARAMYMMGSWHIISAIGFYFIVNLFRKLLIKAFVIVLITFILGISLYSYLNYYHSEYSKRYAIEWQYGMKQIVEFTKEHKEYNLVFMTDIRSQPYIFFLYYLKTPLPEYLDSVIYNNNIDNRSYNNVASFNEFSFGGWDPTESLPKEGVLYVVSPSQYDGLRYKPLFDVKKIIYYPNETEAFYLISIKK